MFFIMVSPSCLRSIFQNKELFIPNKDFFSSKKDLFIPNKDLFFFNKDHFIPNKDFFFQIKTSLFPIKTSFFSIKTLLLPITRSLLTSNYRLAIKKRRLSDQNKRALPLNWFTISAHEGISQIPNIGSGRLFNTIKCSIPTIV